MNTTWSLGKLRIPLGRWAGSHMFPTTIIWLSSLRVPKVHSLRTTMQYCLLREVVSSRWSASWLQIVSDQGLGVTRLMRSRKTKGSHYWLLLGIVGVSFIFWCQSMFLHWKVVLWREIKSRVVILSAVPWHKWRLGCLVTWMCNDIAFPIHM